MSSFLIKAGCFSNADSNIVLKVQSDFFYLKENLVLNV